MVFHGERNFTPGYGQVVREVWTPTKPEDYYYVNITINATGYGEVAFTLNGNTEDYNIGHWTSEPLAKAERHPYIYSKRYSTNIINEDRVGYVNEISPATVPVSATGSAQTRSRQIVTYSSRQTAISAQASATGPGVSFVIGTSTFWKWEAGITRNVNADEYNGAYHVTINDTNIDPGSGSGSGSSTETPSTPSTPSYHACGTHETTVSGNHEAASCGISGHYQCDDSDHSSVNCPADSNNQSCDYGSYYKCSPHEHAYPPVDNTPDCSDCTDGCSSCPLTCANGHTYDPTNGGAVNEHRTRTCRYSECRQTWQKCVSSAPICNKPYRKENGLSCWAE